MIENDWKLLTPSEVMEVFGSIVWNGKSRLLILPRRFIDFVAPLKNKRTAAVYKAEIFLTKKKYEATVQEILEGKKPIPIHLYIQYKNDRT